MDLRLTADAPTTLDFFRVSLLDDGWAFTDGQPGEAEDALGPNVFAPSVSDGGRALDGAFDAGFEALLDPTLRLRAQVDAPPVDDAASLQFLYLAGAGGRPTIAGTTGAPRSALHVRCVGGAIGCAEVDFTFTLLGRPAGADHFRLWLPDAGPWRFAGVQSGEAEDVLGPNVFAAAVTDGGLTARRRVRPRLRGRPRPDAPRARPARSRRRRRRTAAHGRVRAGLVRPPALRGPRRRRRQRRPRARDHRVGRRRTHRPHRRRPSST